MASRRRGAGRVRLPACCAGAAVALSLVGVAFVPQARHLELPPRAAPRVGMAAQAVISESRDVRFEPPADIEKYEGPNPVVRRGRKSSGIASQILKEGDGENCPGRFSVVQLRHTGWRIKDSSVIDSSYFRGDEPEEFKIPDLVAGWRTGVLEMTKGEKRRVWIPMAKPTINPDGSQSEMGQYIAVFDIELVEFTDDPPYFLLYILVALVIAGELYIKVTGEAPGTALMQAYGNPMMRGV
eukprot:TRINITY_DN67974_c0_g1_i1.p1 TRINITY_DN67974_c0_g1~~TRINITY_DN67974_c0_g1_i1.p1  ORF type:complete len:256 (+),score=43.58 TRINITY_DN67974_c0_g1_i1:49-768(+)